MKKIDWQTLPEEKLNEQVLRKITRGDQLEFIQYTYQRGAVFSVHAHPSEQLTVVVEGKLVFTRPQREDIVLNQGQAVLILANEPHGAFVPDHIEQTVTYNIFTPLRLELPNG